jgi:hypothetical protein
MLLIQRKLLWDAPRLRRCTSCIKTAKRRKPVLGEQPDESVHKPRDVKDDKSITVDMLLHTHTMNASRNRQIA